MVETVDVDVAVQVTVWAFDVDAVGETVLLLKLSMLMWRCK